MATCHQDPEPELDYHLELDSDMGNSDFSSGLEVTWGSSLTSETGQRGASSLLLEFRTGDLRQLTFILDVNPPLYCKFSLFKNNQWSSNIKPFDDIFPILNVDCY